MFKKIVTAAFACGLLTVSGASVAQDASPITVQANMARVLRLNAPAATVIIGNPGVADVTIQDAQTLVLTGKSYGQTNLIILDGAGEPIADTLVQVTQMQAGVTTIFQGLSRTTVSCAPVCQPVLMMGDDSDFSSRTLSSAQLMRDAAN